MKRNRDEDAFSPLITNSEASESYIDNSSIDHHSVYSSILEDTREIEEGDLSSLDKRLVAQVTTLDNIFTSLAVKAASMMEYEGFKAAEKCLSLALKAQAQSANSMKILAEIKQPRHIMIAKQANLANQQIVNNGVENITRDMPLARGGKNSQPPKNENELIQIGEVENATLDTRVKDASLVTHEKENP